MIDTLRLGIPLSETQYVELKKLLDSSDKWQWAQVQPSTGDKRYISRRGEMCMDNPSFHRNIFWYIPDSYKSENTFLGFEFSLPKYWYGHNIYLLHDFISVLQAFKNLVETQLNFEVADLYSWRLSRLDCCYAWRAPSELIAEQMLDSLKLLRFPYKKPTIYPTSLSFPGATYSVKFYLKLPEFKKNDRCTLLKQKTSLEYINYLEDIAIGVLRFETTLRRKYLQRNGIDTIADLTEQSVSSITIDRFVDLKRANNDIGLKDLSLKVQSLCIEDREQSDLIYNESMFVADRPTLILKSKLDQYLGENRQMQEREQVRLKLFQKYKSNKAARLLSMWFYVQNYGSDATLRDFGKNPYYIAKAEIEAAGCNFLEPPVLTAAEDDFIKNFNFQIGSPYVVNAVDMPRPSAEELPPLTFVRHLTFEDD